MTTTSPLAMIGAAVIALTHSLGPARASAAPAESGTLTWVSSLEDGRTLRFTVRADGAGLRTEPVPRRMANVVASPDGRRIAYEYGRNVYVAARREPSTSPRERRDAACMGA